jgi:hypothetical protein
LDMDNFNKLISTPWNHASFLTDVAVDSYAGGAPLESQLGHRLSWLTLVVDLYILIIGFCILLLVILTVNNNTFCFATIDKVFIK